jgi:thiol-disulfide isomerase/thioredoxin
MRFRRLFTSLFLVLNLTVASALAAPPQTGRPLPQVQIPTTGGYKIDLAQYSGKTLIIALISVHCPHCLETAQILKRIQTEFAPKGVQVIAAASEDKPYESIPEYVKKDSPNFPLGMVDPPLFMKIAAIGPEVRPVVPVLIFVDTNGVVRYEYFGDHPDIVKNPEPTIRKALAELLKTPAAKPATKK